MKHVLRHRRGRQRGQALLEFAFVAPIFLILVFGIVDFGLGFKTYIAVTNAAREGSRFGAVGWPAGTYAADCNTSTADDTTIVARTCSALAASVDDVNNVSVVFEDRNGIPGIQTGDSIVVTMAYDYHFITPLGGIISAFSGGSIPGSVTLESTADMRLE